MKRGYFEARKWLAD